MIKFNSSSKPTIGVEGDDEVREPKTGGPSPITAKEDDFVD